MNNNSFKKITPSLIPIIVLSFVLSVVFGTLSIVFLKNNIQYFTIAFFILFILAFTIFVYYIVYIILAKVRALQDIASNTEKE